MPSAQLLVTSYLLLVTSFFLIFSPTPVLADTPSASNWTAILQTNFTGNGMLNMFVCWITGFSGSGCVVEKSAGTGPPTTEISYNGEGGALTSAGNLMAGVYQNPPVSSEFYLANMGEQFGIKPAYAQSVTGSGEGVLRPILRLWQITRNLAYIAFILVIIGVGFMIMFRQKINPQTVVTIQQAVPSIVIGLILVTFSYFIASLVVDLTYLGVQLVTQIFILAGGNVFGGARELNGIAQNGNIFNLFGSTLNGNAFGKVFGGTFDQVTTAFGFGSSIIPGVLGAIGGFLAFGPIGAAIGGVGGAAAPLIIPLLIIVILLFALLVQMLRLVFALISAYIEILVLTVTGPFLILMGSIPGRNGSISYWFRGLFANAMIFPGVLAGFFFAGVILGSPNGPGASLFTAYAQATTNDHPTLPLFGSLSADFIKVLIAYGILLGLPAIPTMIKEAFKYKGPQGITQEALAGINGGLLGFNATRVGAGALNQLAYENGTWNPILRRAGGAGWIPNGIRSRIPKPTIPAANPPAGAPGP